MTFPLDVQINAWSQEDVRGEIDSDLARKILGLPFVAESSHLPGTLVSPKKWRDPSIGWGIVLPENLDIPASQRALSDDAPEPIQKLHRDRGGPVFRVGTDWAPGTLRRYSTNGSVMDVALAAAMTGTAPGHIPRYLLIVGGPDVIPWDVQYDLQGSQFVGRLDLDEAGLRNYVGALMSGWSHRPPVGSNTLVWSVDHGSQDITSLMRRTIGKPLHKRFANDQDAALVAGARYLSKTEATHGALVGAIQSDNPGLIVTTSHGETWPLNDSNAMRQRLGLLIDDNRKSLDLSALQGEGAPSGAVWFAQACCSAGSAGMSGYDGILTPGSKAHKVLKAVAACGDMIAPLPTALLGSENPLAAFIGHVEPTFDWSIQHAETGQFMTNSLLETFHQTLFTGHPIGMALDQVRNTGASLSTSYLLASRRLVDERDKAMLGRILALQLTASDWRSIVLLGDPTVTIYPSSALQ